LAAKKQNASIADEPRVEDERQGSGSLAGEDARTTAASREKKSEYVTAHQLAEVLQISEASVHRLRRTGRIPAVMLTDRLIRFNLRDVQKALRPRGKHEDEFSDHSMDDGPSPQLSFDDYDSKFEVE
jgi:hypothetical protein